MLIEVVSATHECKCGEGMYVWALKRIGERLPPVRCNSCDTDMRMISGSRGYIDRKELPDA